jgi:F-type H+-transporting ATPase subunit epsilon
MSTFHLTIVSTNGKAFDGDVESVVLPGVDGEFGILASHTSLIAALNQGLVKITQNGADRFVMISNGYVDVAKNQASVLVGNASALKDRATGVELLAQPKPWEALDALNNR